MCSWRSSADRLHSRAVVGATGAHHAGERPAGRAARLSSNGEQLAAIIFAHRLRSGHAICSRRTSYRSCYAFCREGRRPRPPASDRFRGERSATGHQAVHRSTIFMKRFGGLEAVVVGFENVAARSWASSARTVPAGRTVFDLPSPARLESDEGRIVFFGQDISRAGRRRDCQLGTARTFQHEAAADHVADRQCAAGNGFVAPDRALEEDATPRSRRGRRVDTRCGSSSSASDSISTPTVRPETCRSAGSAFSKWLGARRRSGARRALRRRRASRPDKLALAALLRAARSAGTTCCWCSTT